MEIVGSYARTECRATTETSSSCVMKNAARVAPVFHSV